MACEPGGDGKNPAKQACDAAQPEDEELPEATPLPEGEATESLCPPDMAIPQEVAPAVATVPSPQADRLAIDAPEEGPAILAEGGEALAAPQDSLARTPAAAPMPAAGQVPAGLRAGSDGGDKGIPAPAAAGAPAARGTPPGAEDARALPLPAVAADPVQAARPAFDAAPEPAAILRLAQAAPVHDQPGTPPPHVQASRVIRQIVNRVAVSREVAMQIVLSPEELGKVRIAIGHGEAPVIAVSAERQETLDLLRRNAELLAREMRGAGFSGADISFSDEGGRGGAQAPMRGRREGFDAREAATMPPAGEPARTRTAATGRRIDMRI